MDVSTKQIISVATSLIPSSSTTTPSAHSWAPHAKAGRALSCRAPFVGTGMEARAALDSGDVLIAKATAW